MRQKVLYTTFVLLITASVSNVHAQLFSAVSPSGHTLYYQWNYDDSYYSGGNTQYNSVMVVSSGSAYSNESFNGSVIIPDSVTYGSRKYAVTRINSLMAPNITNLTIPNTVRKIDEDALDLCGFSTLTIPVGVTSVGNGIALNCPNLTTVYYNAKRATQPAGSCGTLFSWTVRNVIIGDSVEHIPSCFCTSRDSLRTVTILGHVKSIGERAFFNCQTLHTVSIVGSVDTIGDNAFSHCDNLRSVVIPKTVVKIDDNVFGYCSNLDTVFYNAKLCTSRYESYESPFYNTNIQMLYIGDSVQRINIYTFPTAPQSVIIKATIPPVLNSSTSSGSYVTNGRVFLGTGTDVIVPCGSLEAYQSQFAWNNNNISDDCVNVVGIANNDSFGIVIGGSTCSPNTPLTLYALPAAGYTFVGWADNNYDNPRNVVSVDGDIIFTAIFSPKDTVILYDTMIVVDTLTQYIDVHDTTYIDVPYAVHDTTYIDVLVHDTTTLYDTMFLTEYVPVHDTTTVTDTIYLPVYVHDTTTVRDTTYLPVYHHDTAYVDIHDTTYINVPYAVHDTSYIDIYVHDTTTIIDTVTLTEFVPVHDTTYIDVHDTTYVDVPYAVHDTTYVDVYIYDTIYIYDTVYVGVDEVDAINAKIYTNRQQIVVEGADGNTVWLYDVNGRVLATKQDEYIPLRFDVPASGAYLVKIGNHPARKVVVIR